MIGSACVHTITCHGQLGTVPGYVRSAPEISRSADIIRTSAFWNAPRTVDTAEPQNEACSNRSPRGEKQSTQRVLSLQCPDFEVSRVTFKPIRQFSQVTRVVRLLLRCVLLAPSLMGREVLIRLGWRMQRKVSGVHTALVSPIYPSAAWDEMRSRARRWLNGEAVLGQYDLRKPRCCEALLVSYHDGLKTERISVDNPAYRSRPLDRRTIEIMNARIEEWLNAH